MGTMIQVEGLPALADRKYVELEQRIRKLFSQAIIDGQMRQLTIVGFQMPKDAAGASQGLACIEFATSAEAMAATDKGSGYKMSSSCTLSTAHLTEAQAISLTIEASKAGMWTPEEDAAILEGVARLGVKNAVQQVGVLKDVNDLKWEQIAQALPGRSASAVRDRYLRCILPAAAPAAPAPAAARRPLWTPYRLGGELDPDVKSRWGLHPILDSAEYASENAFWAEGWPDGWPDAGSPEGLAAWRRHRTAELGLTKGEKKLREQAISEALQLAKPKKEGGWFSWLW